MIARVRSFVVTPNRRGHLIAVAILALAVIFAPAFATSYLMLQIALVGVFAIGAFGLVVLTGHGGQFNLGFAGLMALGAYTAAILQQHGVSLTAALVAAVAIGFVAGALLGVFAYWLSEFAMAVVTFAFGIFVDQAVRAFDGLTGGFSGIVLPRLSLNLVYYTVWTCVAIAALLAWGMIAGWLGRWLRAVRDNAIAAEQLGLPVKRVKFQGYVVTAPFATLTGGLYAQALGYIAPSAFQVVLSLAFLVIIIVGGVTSLWGGLIGATLWVAVPELTVDVPGLYPILFGALTVIVLIVVPGGAMDIPAAIRRRMHRPRRAGAAEVDLSAVAQPAGPAAAVRERE
ncbi:MAG TPA: branched-chain amino acid ABC transporter permease [Solirubrobacter sp.]|nr:branched-chain amino acid ABC transporter permease [Solirubrobacter sp.]